MQRYKIRLFLQDALNFVTLHLVGYTRKNTFAMHSPLNVKNRRRYFMRVDFYGRCLKETNTKYESKVKVKVPT
jgi:hypothetical protein